MNELSDTDRIIRVAIADAMRERQLRQGDVAELLGVTRSHVTQLLTGHRGKVPESLVQLLQVLGLELRAVPRQDREVTNESIDLE